MIPVRNFCENFSVLFAVSGYFFVLTTVFDNFSLSIILFMKLSAYSVFCSVNTALEAYTAQSSLFRLLELV